VLILRQHHPFLKTILFLGVRRLWCKKRRWLTNGPPLRGIHVSKVVHQNYPIVQNEWFKKSICRKYHFVIRRSKSNRDQSWMVKMNKYPYIAKFKGTCHILLYYLRSSKGIKLEQCYSREMGSPSPLPPHGQLWSHHSYYSESGWD
jgi:hypothetical protein